MACHPASAEASARAAGELLAVAGAQGVPQAGLDLADVGFELARDGRGAQAAVQQPDVVGLALQDADDGGVDAPGRGDLPEQLGVLPGTGHRALRGRAAVICRGVSPSRIRAWSGMSRPLAMRSKTWVVADAPDAVDDFAHPALAEADRGADAHLAEPEVLLEQPE